MLYIYIPEHPLCGWLSPCLLVNPIVVVGISSFNVVKPNPIPPIP